MIVVQKTQMQPNLSVMIATCTFALTVMHVILALTKSYKLVPPLHWKHPNKLLNAVENPGELHLTKMAPNGQWPIVPTTACVYFYNGSDQYLQSVGCKGDRIGEFQHPEGISSDSSDNLYVVDYINHRVQKFDASTDYIHVTKMFGAQEREGVD